MCQHPVFAIDEVYAFDVMTRIHSAASASGRLRDEIAPPDQVVRRGAEGKHPIDETAAPVAEFPKQRHGLQPPKGLLDQLAFALTERVAGMTGGAAINRAPAARAMYCAMWGVTRIVRNAATQARVSNSLSAATVMRRLVKGKSPTMAIAASRYAVPPALVTAVSTIRPCRLSVSRCPR